MAAQVVRHRKLDLPIDPGILSRFHRPRGLTLDVCR